MFNGDGGTTTCNNALKQPPMTFSVSVPTVAFDNLWVRSQGQNMQVSLNGGVAVALTANTIISVGFANAGTITTLEFTNSAGGTYAPTPLRSIAALPLNNNY